MPNQAIIRKGVAGIPPPTQSSTPSTPREIAQQSEPRLRSGACLLKHPEAAEIVWNALRHFDGQRYRLHAWCIMPNHVHVVVSPLGDHGLPEILHSWKSFTAHAINQALGRKGEVWERESFDHLIRSADAVDRFISYTQNNPVEAGLCEHPEN
jgi:REP element-mobilizing transposase RayT